MRSEDKIEVYDGSEECSIQDEGDENQNNNSKYHKFIRRTEKRAVLVNKAKNKNVSYNNNPANVQMVSNERIDLNSQRGVTAASDKQLNIVYFNARSIKNKMDEFRIFVYQNKPDIIGIVETWLNEDQLDSELEIKDYNFLRKDRKNEFQSQGGGIIIYYKSELSMVDIISDYNLNIDHIWVKIYMSSSKPISMGYFYRPPDSTEEQEKFLIDMISKYKTRNTIVIGDFNYGDINWKNNTAGSAGKKFLKVCTELSLCQCVKNKTRGNNILDLAMVYEKNFIYKITQMAPLARSDHNVLNILLNVRVKYKNTFVKCYSYNKANYGILEDKLNEVNWEEEVINKDVNQIWEGIKNVLVSFKESSIKQFKKSTANDVPWLNAKIKKLIKKRNNLFKRFKKNNQSYSKMKYIIARNDVTKKIR